MDGDELEQAAQTAAEHGAAAAAAAGGGPVRAKASRPAALSPDAPDGVCANCGTTLQGPVCHNCGQVDDEYHRPVHGLASEIFEGLTALDGRVLRTLPALLFRPGRLTRAFLKGKRARYMPPFRLYIIASLIFFLLIPGLDGLVDSAQSGAAGMARAERAEMMEEAEAQIRDGLADGSMTPREAERVRATLDMIGLGQGVSEPPDQPEAETEAETGAESGAESGDAANAPTDPAAETAPPATGADEGALNSPVVIAGAGDVIDLDIGDARDPEAIRRFFAPEDFGEPAIQTSWPLPVRRYLGDRFAEVAADPGGWLDAVTAWIPRIMFVMVPVYALLLGLIYVWRRGFYFFDHLIVSLHVHSALFLVMALLMLTSNLIGAGWAWLILIVYSNVYLYRVHRVVYARGRFTSVLRTLFLDTLYFVVLLIGFLAVLLLGALV
ncbi:MAG: DUF3667 domain-containing protein [Oceanicaulis sp.]